MTSQPRPAVGMVFLPSDAGHALDLIGRAERAGVPSIWLEMNAFGLDPFPLLAAGAASTQRIGLGTAIVPAFSRHPVAMATQALAVEGMAPGRLRLGVGPGNADRMAQVFGQPSDRTLPRLREYVQILRGLLHEGQARFEGEFYTADVELPSPPSTPVLVSALGPKAFAAAGELADGAVSWLCPVDYLLDVAVPAIAAGAASAGRAAPPLIAHVPVALGRAGDLAELREAARRDLALYARVPVFARMLAAAGHPIVDGVVTDELLDDLVVMGDEDAVASRLATILGRGIDELMVSLIPETHDRPQEDALLRLSAALAGGAHRPG
jgi:F420-dependent oxidoreductase-like protein